MPAGSFSRDIPPLRGFSLGLVYFTLSFPLGSWVGRIPQIKESLGADDASWGLASTIATFGEIVGLAIIVVLIGRTSTRTTTIVTAIVVLAMGPLVALSPTLPALVASLTLWMIASKILGTTSGALILVHQRDLGRIIFGRFDALYSFGMLIGGALSWAAIRQGIPASHQFAITNSMLAIALLISLRALPDEEAPTTTTEPLRQRLRSRFTGPLLLLGGLSLLASFIDSAAAQWAGIYLSRTAGGDPALGSLGYVMVVAAKGTCLLFIGTIVAHIGWRTIVLISVTATSLALLLGVGSGLVLPGVIALLVLGAGTAFFGPMVNTLASAQPGVTDGEARTMLETGELPAYVMTPVLVGVLASVLDVRWAFLMMTCLPLLACGALFLAPGPRRLLTAHENANRRGSTTSGSRNCAQHSVGASAGPRNQPDLHARGSPKVQAGPMRIFAIPTRQISAHASHGVVMDFLPRMARTAGTRVSIARIEAGGTIGEHRAPVRQIFAVVDGRGEVAAGGGSRRQIEAGQAAVWEPGEMHQSWASVDMLVAIVETAGEIELDEHFVEVHD